MLHEFIFKNIFQITTLSKNSKLWLGLWLLYDNIHHSIQNFTQDIKKKIKIEQGQ
jgi:hypothetical protein